jgi:hypothetical protein
MKIKMWKKMSLLMAGGMMLQLGGCFGDFFNIMLANVPVGAGRALGAIPAGIISDLIDPILGILPT